MKSDIESFREKNAEKFTMLIMFYHSSLKVGGAIQRFLNIRKIWERMGVKMIILENMPTLTSSIKIPMPTVNGPYSTVLEVLRSAFYILFSTILGIFYPVNFDLVLCRNNEWITMLPAIIIAKVRRKKTVVIVHHFDIIGSKSLAITLREIYKNMRRRYSLMFSLLKALTTRLGLALVMKFDARICVSQTFMELFPDSHKSTNTISEEVLERIQLLQYSDNEKLYDVCYIGRLVPEKGVIDLLDIWKKVITIRNHGERLVLIGTDHMGIRKYIKAFGLYGQVEYKGVLSDDEKFKTIIQSKVFATASKSEGWGIVIAEALLCGVPVVCYNILPLYMEWQKCPYVFFANDVQDFALKLVNILNGKNRFDSTEITKWALGRLKTYDHIARRDLEVISELFRAEYD